MGMVKKWSPSQTKGQQTPRNDGDGSFSTSKEERQCNKKQEDIQINIHIRVPNNNPTKMMTTTKAELPSADLKIDDTKCGILLNSFLFF
jgi:hypothetical protein